MGSAAKRVIGSIVNTAMNSLFVGPIAELVEPVEYSIRGDANDLRFGDLVMRGATQHPEVVIVGFPEDSGVARNGGRLGAALGPDQIRKQLGKLTPDARNLNLSLATLESTVDVGNVRLGTSLEESQQRLGSVVEYVLQSDSIPVVLGGGHETAFGHFLGYRSSIPGPSIVNIDAHADVRPLISGVGHSGSPFRQAIEMGVRTYSVFGLAPHSVAKSHIEYLDSHGMHYFWRDELTSARVERELDRLGAPVMLTIDLDVVDIAYAPGVSAPSVGGISSRELIEIAFACGRHPAVRSLDVVELNPNYDVDDRTARLAAVVVWEFMRGISMRKFQHQRHNP